MLHLVNSGRVNEDAEIWFHKPGKQVWSHLSEVMETLIKFRHQGEVEHLPDEFFTPLMGLPIGSQDPLPPKPALKKSKQGNAEGTLTSNANAQSQVAGKGVEEGPIGAAIQGQNQGGKKILSSPEKATHDVRA